MGINKIESGLQSIPKAIKSEVFRTFLLTTGSQLMAVFLIMAYLSYKEAGNRADFLANSNHKSIGLMASTGDIFQLNNLIRSFVNDSTVMSDFVDRSHKSLIKNQSEKTLFWKTLKISILDGNLTLVTAHDIEYANTYVGTLLLANKLKFFDWVILCFVIILISMMAFLFQGFRLQRRSLSVASYINDIRQFFYSFKDEETLSKFAESRRKSDLIEIESLSADIYKMLRQILVSVKLEKEASIGRIVEHLAHDLRAPLGAFERLLQASDHEIPAMRKQIQDSLNRLHSMVHSLRFSEEENIVKRSVDQLNFVFASEILSRKNSDRKVSLSIPKAPLLNLNIDHAKTERAWLNLISNALEFARTFVNVEAEVKGADLILRVIDDGPGVPDEFLPKLFQRGATYGKHDGTGLGLAYVRQIMRGHGGDVVYQRENCMTVFECYLPNAVVKIEKTEAESHDYEAMKPSEIKQISICFESAELSQRVFNRLSDLTQGRYRFVMGISQESSIVLTDSEDIADQLPDTKVRPILMSSLSDDEIIRRAPIRIGLKG